MGGHLLTSSKNACGDDESASLFFDRCPLSAGSAPSPLLLGNVAKKPTTTRRHAVARFICTPFTVIYRMNCARASTSDNNKVSNDKAKVKRGVARRPSLEQLLRMEDALSPSCPEHKSTQEPAVSNCREEEEQEPLSLSKSHCAIATENGGQQTPIVPVKVDIGLRVNPGESAPAASKAVPVSSSLRRALLQALRVDLGLTKGRYRKLDASRAAGGKAELFYQRPILLGRRCRVQHLDDSPYL